MRRVALYVRVSTVDQHPDNQLVPLRAFAAARSWEAAEFVDRGQSGAKERRPELDQLLAAARSRTVDVVACVKLDRLARSVRHLVTLGAEFEALGVDLVVLDQSIDTTTPSGRLLFHVLGAIAEFERSLIIDRVRAGMQRAKAHGTRSGKRIGRPRKQFVDVTKLRELLSAGASMRGAAKSLGVHSMTVKRFLLGATNLGRIDGENVPSTRRFSGQKSAATNHRLGGGRGSNP